MAEKSTPATPSRYNAAMAAEWALARALLGGTPAMRTAGKTYLPTHEGEEDDQYKARLGCTFLLNEFERGVLNASAKPFSQDVSFETRDNDLALIAQDVDLMGRSLSVFARSFFEDAVAMSRGWIMVDYPRSTSEGRSLADQAGERPYWQLIRAEDVLAAYGAVIDGVPQFSHVRVLLTDVEREENGWGESTIKRVLVMEPGQWQIWREKDGDWVQEDEFSVSIQRVPMIPFDTGRRLGAGMTKGVFSDLAWKNVEHWQSSSEQRVALKYGRFPILKAIGTRPPRRRGPTGRGPTGRDDDDKGAEITLGPARMLYMENAAGNIDYIEPPGRAMEAGFKDLETIELQMRLLALRPQLPQTGHMTATSRMLDEIQANSAIQNMTLMCADALHRAFDMTALWYGREGVERNLSLNTEFGLDMEQSGELEHLFKMWEGGALSTETLWEEGLRRGVLGSNFDSAVEIDRLAASEAGPGFAPATANGGGDDGS